MSEKVPGPDGELLLRQIHPNCVTSEGTISSAAFKPSKQHHFKLSLYDDAVFTATEAFAHYTKEGAASAGVMGVSCVEVASLDLGATRDNEGFDGHVSVDFSDLSNKSRKDKATELKHAAIARDWLHRGS